MLVGFDQEALGAFARTVSHLLGMRAVVSGGAARSYDELLALACRKVDEIAPVNVSRKAQDKAAELGLGDLRTYCWHCPISTRSADRVVTRPSGPGILHAHAIPTACAPEASIRSGVDSTCSRLARERPLAGGFRGLARRARLPAPMVEVAPRRDP